MKLFHFPYELKFLEKYTRFQENRKGSLLRIQDNDGYFGYADLHQWPICLDSPQAKIALQVAKDDLQYRKNGQSVWEEFSNTDIENNYLLVNFSDPAEIKLHYLTDEMAKACELGFRFVKVKVGENLDLELKRLKKLIYNFPNLTWRLDFNSLSNFEQSYNFFSMFSGHEISKIEYVEDPFSYESTSWIKLNKVVPLALDQAATAHFDLEEINNKRSFQHRILKPAIQDCLPWINWSIENNKKITITSFMDHPLGQIQALRKNLEIKKNLGSRSKELLNVSGLRTDFLFEQNNFSSHFESVGPQLKVSKELGLGLGFDHQLEALQWQNCN